MASGKWFLHGGLPIPIFLKFSTKISFFQKTYFFWLLGNAEIPTDLKPYWSRGVFASLNIASGNITVCNGKWPMYRICTDWTWWLFSWHSVAMLLYRRVLHVFTSSGIIPVPISEWLYRNFVHILPAVESWHHSDCGGQLGPGISKDTKSGKTLQFECWDSPLGKHLRSGKLRASYPSSRSRLDDGWPEPPQSLEEQVTQV